MYLILTPMFPFYRDQSIIVQYKSIDWFLYVRNAKKFRKIQRKTIAPESVF